MSLSSTRAPDHADSIVDASELQIEPSSSEESSQANQPASNPPPVLRTRGNSISQQATDPSNSTATPLKSNHEIREEFRTDIANAKEFSEKIAQQSIKFSKNIDSNGILKLSNLGSEALQELTDFIQLSPNLKLTGIKIVPMEIESEEARSLAHLIQSNNAIKTLDCSQSFIDPLGFEALLEAISSSDMTSLDLSGTNADDKMIASLADALKNSRMTHLRLCHIYLSDKACQALVDLVKNNSSITSLDISIISSNNKMGDTIKNITLQSALTAQKNIIENQITDALNLLTQGNAVTDVNKQIAEKLFLLDKGDKLADAKVINNPDSVLNKYT